MKQVAYLCSSAVLVLGLQPSCLLPAVDDTGHPNKPTFQDAGNDASVVDASSDDAGAAEPLLLRAAYSYRAPGANVDTLDLVAFSGSKRGEAQHLFTRPTISSAIGSRDGNRLAFLANDSNAPAAPNVVWLLDGLDEGNEPTTIASSNPALPRTALMADGNLDYILSCSGLEYCEQLELYRRNERTFTTIATNVWAAVVGYDNGLLVYQTENLPLRIYWLDLTEVDAVPQLLMTAGDEDHIPFIGPAMLAQTGRTFTYIDAIVHDNTTVSDLSWTVFGTKLGQSDPTPLQSGVGLIATYTQGDGASALIVPTDVQGRHTKIVRHALGASGFETGQELFNKELEQEINLGTTNDIALAPLLDTYDNYFYFFGAPQAIVQSKVFLTPHVLALDGSAPVAMTTEPCQVFPSGHDMLSPRVSLTAQSTAASLGWLRCNREVGYINLDQANSFVAVDTTCPECSPGKYFAPIGEGVVFAHIDANAVSTPHYYATKENLLELIPGGSEVGELENLVVSRSDAPLPRWRYMWHMGGAIGLELPRSWRKFSQSVDDEPIILAGPTVYLGNDPLTAGGVRISVSTDTTRSPEQTVAELPERTTCATNLASDTGSLTLNGVAYEFYSERHMNCDGGAHRWFLALKASDHCVQLVFHDPQGSGESDFNQMWATIRVEPSRLNLSSSAMDAGAGD